jgi:response regulator RpfG family c-di-GMP phosphodiesterase
VLGTDSDLCVAFWKSRDQCPVELLRDFQASHPTSCLVCCSAKPDPWLQSFLVGAGVCPDLVVSGPLSAEELMTEAKRLLALRRSDATEHLVVCVDDDNAFLSSLEQSLPGRLAGRTPFETTFEFLNDPREAVELLAECEEESTSIAMIVTDHVMPELTGVELLGRVKKAAPFAVRVLLTGQAGMQEVVSAVNARTLDHYISKPIADLDQFSHTLGHLLNEYDLSARNRLRSWHTYEEYQFVNALARKKTLSEVLDRIVGFVATMLEAERVSLMLCEGGELKIRAARGLPDDVVKSTSVPVGSGIAGQVFAKGAPLYVTDAGELAEGSPVRSPCSVFASVPLIVAPMTMQERPLGIINVTDRAGDKPLTRSEMMFLSHAADAASIAVSNHLERQQREEANFDTIRSLDLALEAKDRYTRGHSERVALHSVMIAEVLGLGDAEIEMLERAATMHDVGKIGVPEEIIHKPAALTAAEFEHVRKHPVIGERIVSQLTFMTECLPVIRGHHERLDGGGYPDGLEGEVIPLGARIIAVADSYDAMTSERPYRSPMAQAEALAELERCVGTQFDPACVRALVEVVRERVVVPGGVPDAPAPARAADGTGRGVGA